jgi:phosphopantothenoylcysteine synthetase/decarboxylase
VCVIASPVGRRFLAEREVAELTGFPVRSDYKMPGEGDALPQADAVIVAPATLGTTCKFAAGIADTLVVSLLCELLGFGVPILLVPLLKPQLAAHPAFGEALDRLGKAGVRILYDPDAPQGPDRWPSWRRIFETFNEMTR